MNKSKVLKDLQVGDVTCFTKLDYIGIIIFVNVN